jgi:hypothetical protein
MMFRTLRISADHARELAARVSDGIHVTLLWHPRRDAVSLSVADERTGEIFEFGVPRDRALDAFHHPFAYAARQGVDYEAPLPQAA